MSQKSFILAHPTARKLAKEAVDQSPDGYHIIIKEPTRTLDQNALIHVELTELGKKIGWKFNGQDVDVDDLKTIFMAAYRKAMGIPVRFVIGIDGQPVIMDWRTRKLTKKECSEFIEIFHAWEAENVKEEKAKN